MATVSSVAVITAPFPPASQRTCQAEHTVRPTVPTPSTSTVDVVHGWSLRVERRPPAAAENLLLSGGRRGLGESMSHIDKRSGSSDHQAGACFPTMAVTAMDPVAGRKREVTMELVHEMTYHALLRAPLPVGDGPFGNRMYFEVIEGKLDGPRIRGRFVGGGGDWLLVAPDGFGRLDVRAQLETDDGAFVYLHYGGVVEMNEAVQAAMASASSTEFADQYFRTAPRFETGDPRYGWLNQTMFLAEGRLYPGFGVEYRVYRIT
jgi:hypothetical protein